MIWLVGLETFYYCNQPYLKRGKIQSRRNPFPEDEVVLGAGEQ